jgi:hypothetical protein
MKYTGVPDPREEGGFTVRGVEIPGAITQGDTREEVLANIREAGERFSKSSGKNFTVNHLHTTAGYLKSKWYRSLNLPVVSGEDRGRYLTEQGFEAKRRQRPSSSEIMRLGTHKQA